MKNPQLDKIKGQALALKSNPKAIMVIAGVILLLDVVFVLRGQVISVFGMFKEARKLRADIKTTREDEKFFSTYQNRVSTLDKELKDLDKMSVLEEQLPEVIESISKFADISGVRILKIKPIIRQQDRLQAPQASATEGATKFDRQQFSLTANAGFHQLGRFVALIENSPVFIDIKNIEIRGNDKEPTVQLVTILLEVVVATT